MKNKKITKKIILLLVIAVLFLAVITGLWLFPERSIQEYTTAKVEKIDLIQTVSEVGSVKSAQEIELSFGQGGKVGAISVKVGDIIKEGQVLAELDYQTLIIQRKEAESNLAAAEANLRKIRSGASREEIAVVEAQVEAAKASYSSSESTLEKTESRVADSISQAEKTLADLESTDPSNITREEQAVSSAQSDLANTKTVYGNSVNNKKDSLLTAINSKLSVANTSLDTIDGIINNDDLDDYLSSKDTSYLINSRVSYDQAKILFSEANNSLSVAKIDKTDILIGKSATDALAVLNKTADTLDLCFKALEYSSFSATVSDAYKTSVSAEISSISAGIVALETATQGLSDTMIAYNTNVSSAENALRLAQASFTDAVTTAKNSLSTARTSGDRDITSAQSAVSSAKESWNVAESQLNSLKAPARQEDIDLNQSKVRQAQAALDLIGRQLEDSLIKSPIDGKVVNIEYEIGELVVQSRPAISVLAENSFEVEVDISESDIAKIELGDQADITLDAFGEDKVFPGQVDFIEPAETIIQDVIYYKVKINFKGNIEELAAVKSGMTANVSIMTALRSGVLSVPTRAILEKDGGRYLRVWRNNKVEEHKVEIGLRGDGGFVEVYNEVHEGDEVVTYAKESKKRIFRY